MSFRITGLSPEPFRHLYGLPEHELASHGATRYVADKKPGFPDRIEVRDAEPGETLLLLNHIHQPANNAYHSSHAIFIREGAETAYNAVDEIPEVMRVRMMSVRAFDRDDMIIRANAVPGGEMQPLVERFLADPDVAYLHAHYCARGCFAARIDRAESSA